MDVLYSVRKGNTNEELRHSLRSLRNIPHDRVFIAGYKPDWVKNVCYVKTKQIESKYKNVVGNLRAACQVEELSEDFILMNDDFFILRKMSEVPMFHRGPIAEVIEKKADIKSRWMNGMRQALPVIQSLGIETPLSYELHVPMVMNKRLFLGMLQVREALMPDVEAFQKRSLYGNLYQLGGERMDDVKVLGNGRKFALENWTFASTHEGSFRSGFIGQHIRQAFPRRCQFEVPRHIAPDPSWVQVFERSDG